MPTGRRAITRSTIEGLNQDKSTVSYINRRVLHTLKPEQTTLGTPMAGYRWSNINNECVEHNHNLVIVEDCSTSWSSDDDDDRSTTSSLDKVDDDATSVASDDATPCTLDGDDGSCSSHDDATTSPSTTPHCLMSQGDTKVSNDDVVDHVDSYDELVSRLASMTMSLENEKAKTEKLKKKLFSKEHM